MVFECSTPLTMSARSVYLRAADRARSLLAAQSFRFNRLRDTGIPAGSPAMVARAFAVRIARGFKSTMGKKLVARPAPRDFI